MWIKVTTCASIPLREGRSLTLRGRELALFNMGDRFVAVDGRCPHKGGPLSDGIMSGESVVCPLHAWKIGLTTGAVERPATVNACVHVYETRVEDGVVSVHLPMPATKTA